MQTRSEDGTLEVRSRISGCFLWLAGIGGGLAVGAAAVLRIGELWRLGVVALTVAAAVWVAYRLAGTSVRIGEGVCEVVRFSGRSTVVPVAEVDGVAAGPFPGLRLRDGSSLVLWSVIDDGDLEAVVEAIESTRGWGGWSNADSSEVDEHARRVSSRLSRQQRGIKIAIVVAVCAGYLIRAALA